MIRYMERKKPMRSAFHRCVVKCFLGHDNPAGECIDVFKAVWKMYEERAYA